MKQGYTVANTCGVYNPDIHYHINNKNQVESDSGDVYSIEEFCRKFYYGWETC